MKTRKRLDPIVIGSEEEIEKGLKDKDWRIELTQSLEMFREFCGSICAPDARRSDTYEKRPSFLMYSSTWQKKHFIDGKREEAQWKEKEGSHKIPCHRHRATTWPVLISDWSREYLLRGLRNGRKYESIKKDFAKIENYAKSLCANLPNYWK